jgi:hypothetical protein
MCPSFPLWEGPHWHAMSDGRFIVILTSRMRVTITSHQSNFYDIMSEQGRNKKYKLNILSQDGKTIRDTRGLVWPSIVIDHRARYIPQPGSGTHRPCLTLLRDSSTTSHSARGLIKHTSCCARGLFRPLSDHNSTSDFLGYMWNWTHIQLEDNYFLDLTTRLMPRLPASLETTSVWCTCRCISVSSFHEISF